MRSTKDNQTKQIQPTINTVQNKRKINTIHTPPNTPISTLPFSPSSSQNQITFNNDAEYSVEQTLKYHQFLPIEKIANTLQGSVWKVTRNDSTYIVKVTNKILHKSKITNWNGRQIHVSENIIKEASILKYLTEHNPPKSLVKFYDFFSDEFNYIFVMEYGGEMSLFEFVKDCHQYIECGLLSMNEWHKFCKIAMKQMVDLIDWLHNSMNCCHLDLSLENIVIDNVMVMEHCESKTITFLPGFQVRIIDFGVASVFYAKNNKIDFQSNKYVGKTQYKAPEVYAENVLFDARSADCWSLGVVFFILMIGCPPWEQPSMNDITFNFIMSGHLDQIIVGWNKCTYITPNFFCLLTQLFQNPKIRLTITEIKKHPFLL